MRDVDVTPSDLTTSPENIDRTRGPLLRRLVLTNFRSYAALELETGRALVALTGDNGVGKTNILEAISLLQPGRGLRRAEAADCVRHGARGFAISAAIEPLDGAARKMGLGLGADGARVMRIDGANVGSTRAFADLMRVVWLTPAMDGLFAGPAGDRRRFLDRLVLTVDPGHGARVTAFERALRNRNRLLETDGAPAWLDAAEREAAELAISVASARRETVARLAALIAARRDESSPFPYAELDLVGPFEEMTCALSALAAEDALRAALRDNRWRDRAAGRTLMGPQTSDLNVRHGPKQAEARLCSTGEQKALLTGLILAHAALVGAMSGMAPLVLLDEIGAHFDPRRRAALFAELEKLGGQVWMTGADAAIFAELEGRADIFAIADGAAHATS